jgi:hypothetical protein
MLDSSRVDFQFEHFPRFEFFLLPSRIHARSR